MLLLDGSQNWIVCAQRGEEEAGFEHVCTSVRLYVCTELVWFRAEIILVSTKWACLLLTIRLTTMIGRHSSLYDHFCP